MVLAAFGGGELLAVSIPTLVPLVFFSLCLALVYAVMRLNPSMHKTGTPWGGGGERACKVTTYF